VGAKKKGGCGGRKKKYPSSFKKIWVVLGLKKKGVGSENFFGVWLEKKLGRFVRA